MEEKNILICSAQELINLLTELKQQNNDKDFSITCSVSINYNNEFCSNLIAIIDEDVKQLLEFPFEKETTEDIVKRIDEVVLKDDN